MVGQEKESDEAVEKDREASMERECGERIVFVRGGGAAAATIGVCIGSGVDKIAGEEWLGRRREEEDRSEPLCVWMGGCLALSLS